MDGYWCHATDGMQCFTWLTKERDVPVFFHLYSLYRPRFEGWTHGWTASGMRDEWRVL